MINNNKQYRYGGLDEINSVESRLATIRKYEPTCKCLKEEENVSEELFLNGLEGKLDCVEMMRRGKR